MYCVISVPLFENNTYAWVFKYTEFALLMFC